MQAHYIIFFLLATLIFELISLNKEVLTKQLNHKGGIQHHKKKSKNFYQKKTHHAFNTPDNKEQLYFRVSQPVHHLLVSETCSIAFQQRIRGGNVVTQPKSFPYVAALFYCKDNNYITTLSTTTCQQFCQGSIITKLHILTTANCLTLNNGSANPSKLIVRVGVHDLNTAEVSRTVFKAIAIFIHHEYDPRRLLNDIALIKLVQPMTFTEFIQLVCINGLYDYYKFPYLNVIIAGQGLKEPINIADARLYPVLKYAKLYIDNFYNCNGYETQKLLQFCVKTWSTPEGYPCRGDQGGGLLPLNYNQQYVNILVGIFSSTGKFNAYGSMECNNELFFVNVSTYALWINRHVAL